MEEKIENDHILRSLISLCKEIDNKKPFYVWKYRRAYLGHLNNYWNFAVAVHRVFEEKTQRAEILKFENENINDELISASINFYSYAKVCLDACKSLSNNTIYSTISDEKAEELQKLREENKRMAKKIALIRNKVGAHPGDSSCLFIGDVSWGGVNNRVKFSAFDLGKMRMVKKEFELNPNEHLLEMERYINSLIEKLKDCWGSIKD